MDARDLEGLTRDQLIERAERAGVTRPTVLTRAELVDEILRRSVTDVAERKRARGLLGLARDLLASVVDRGLHLPEAAELIRGPREPRPWPPAKPPLATVTLAEIYAAQGHRERALSVLDEVLAKESDHAVARALRDRIAASAEMHPAMPPEPEEQAPEPEPEPVPKAPRARTAIAPSAEPTEPEPMLDDEPLPPIYEVDEVVALPVDPRTLYVYWEIRTETLEAARREAKDGELVVRVVAVSATWEGPVSVTRDVEVHASMGDWFVRDLPPGAILRVAVGWRSPSGFAPFAVGLEVAAPPEAPAPVAAAILARFTPAGAVELEPPVDAQVGPYARAVESYREKLAHDVVEHGAEEGVPSVAATGAAPGVRVRAAGVRAAGSSEAFGGASPSSWA